MAYLYVKVKEILVQNINHVIHRGIKIVAFFDEAK